MGEIALTFFYLTAGVTGVTIGIEMYRKDRRYQGLTTVLFGLWIMLDAIRWFIVLKAFNDYSHALSASAAAHAASIGEAVQLMEEKMIKPPACVSRLDWLEIMFAFAGTGLLINEHTRERHRWLCFLLIMAYFAVNAGFWLTAYFVAGDLRDYAMAAKSVWLVVWTGNAVPAAEMQPRIEAGALYLGIGVVCGLVTWRAMLRRPAVGSSSRTPKQVRGWWKRMRARVKRGLWWEKFSVTNAGRAVLAGALVIIGIAVALAATGSWVHKPMLSVTTLALAMFYVWTHPRSKESAQWVFTSATLFAGFVLEVGDIVATR